MRSDQRNPTPESDPQDARGHRCWHHGRILGGPTGFRPDTLARAARQLATAWRTARGAADLAPYPRPLCPAIPVFKPFLSAGTP
jgi:hypothetical protein